MDLGLDGSKAIVLASSKGLGKAVSTELVSEGATVALNSRHASSIEEAKHDILDETGAPDNSVRSMVCDLSSTDDIIPATERTIGDLGGLDILITNHGGPPAYNFDEATLSDFDHTYTSVLKSTIAVIKAALPYIRQDGGAITNIVSASAQESPENHILSNTIRPGIYGLSKRLSKEYGKEEVRVNCVCPRGIMTDRIEYKIEKLAEREDISINEARKLREDELSVERLGTPQEFAQSVTYISSNAAKFTTGAVLEVDGGWKSNVF